ncbi:unnamed protein product [Clonostachys solani]|uniref:Peroxidase n=1 Tax=Clonostachys solani TaxID=160281 RepID=A0A9P0EQU7_9HYPO|nr:unnamed protein product [Clonostachys solani]
MSDIVFKWPQHLALEFYLAIFITASTLAYYLYIRNPFSLSASAPSKQKRGLEDYQQVYNEIARRLEENLDYDDGSYGPILVRLAWHASGTYDARTDSGGSNGATMRFHPECSHEANSGLMIAQNFLEDVKVKFPWITYADLWILGGIAAIQEMKGPIIPWRPGRLDKDASHCPADGRLPDATRGSSHLRDVFYRMGFNDQEIVALCGAHSLGRCHADRLGFEGAWTYSPTIFTNQYYDMLLGDQWVQRKWDGPRQFQGSMSQTLMMLPSDLALIEDKAMRTWVEKYAEDTELFFSHFREAVTKLFEFGVPFAEGIDRWSFQPLWQSS